MNTEEASASNADSDGLDVPTIKAVATRVSTRKNPNGSVDVCMQHDGCREFIAATVNQVRLHIDEDTCAELARRISVWYGGEPIHAKKPAAGGAATAKPSEPPNIWTEHDGAGGIDICAQVKGHDKFVIASVNYDYLYMDNATRAALARQIVVWLGGTPSNA